MVAGGGMRVVVTGAKGYLGSRLFAALVDAGHTVRVLGRSSSDVSRLPRDVDLAYGDVIDDDSLAAAFDACDIVFHAVVAVEPSADPSVSASSALRMRKRRRPSASAPADLTVEDAEVDLGAVSKRGAGGPGRWQQLERVA